MIVRDVAGAVMKEDLPQGLWELVTLSVTPSTSLDTPHGMTFDRDLTAQEQVLIDQVYASARRGLMRNSLENLMGARIADPSERYRSLQAMYSERFAERSAPLRNSEGPLFGQVLEAFQAYWHEVLTEKLNEVEGAEFLFSRLVALVNEDPGTSKYSRDRLAVVGEKLRNELSAQGIFSLWGRVLPYYEFMAWKSETEVKTAVTLSQGETIDVLITYLDDFVSLGWTGFATFDKIHNGGWATKERLFCVRPYYDLESERFKVSYLAHEARHFSDYKRFPCLRQTDLEYRAKLTELALANETLLDLVNEFRRSAFNDPASPHPFAAHHLTQRLESEMAASIDRPDDPSMKEALRIAAGHLLIESDARLESMGADTVQGVLQ